MDTAFIHTMIPPGITSRACQIAYSSAASFRGQLRLTGKGNVDSADSPAHFCPVLPEGLPNGDKPPMGCGNRRIYI
jgi:hypothetical protein